MTKILKIKCCVVDHFSQHNYFSNHLYLSIFINESILLTTLYLNDFSACINDSVLPDIT